MRIRGSIFVGWAPPVVVLGMLLFGAGSGSALAAKNKCGCTLNESNNTCSCSKGAKCGCPGECEPKGCEEKRSAQMKKEVDAETKKAAEADRKHKAASSAETRTASARESTDGDNGKPAKAAAKGPKMPPAQVKQLAKLLDTYLKSNPEARSKNAEELRNSLSLAPAN